MEIREAIEYLKPIAKHPTMTGNYCEALNVALQALEKQIPKPPTYEVKEKYKALGKNYYCSCGVMVVDFERNGTNYCGNCGQKLRSDT